MSLDKTVLKNPNANYYVSDSLRFFLSISNIFFTKSLLIFGDEYMALCLHKFYLNNTLD